MNAKSNEAIALFNKEAYCMLKTRQEGGRLVILDLYRDSTKFPAKVPVEEKDYSDPDCMISAHFSVKETLKPTLFEQVKAILTRKDIFARTKVRVDYRYPSNDDTIFERSQEFIVNMTVDYMSRMSLAYANRCNERLLASCPGCSIT